MALASAHGLITVAIGTADKVVVATDRTRDIDAPAARGDDNATEALETMISVLPRTGNARAKR